MRDGVNYVAAMCDCTAGAVATQQAEDYAIIVLIYQAMVVEQYHGVVDEETPSK